jgi:hypothetical protein
VRERSARAASRPFFQLDPSQPFPKKDVMIVTLRASNCVNRLDKFTAALELRQIAHRSAISHSESRTSKPIAAKAFILHSHQLLISNHTQSNSARQKQNKDIFGIDKDNYI